MSDRSHSGFEWTGTEEEIITKPVEGSKLAETSVGIIEYATAGEGPEIPGVHGGLVGYDLYYDPLWCSSSWTTLRATSDAITAMKYIVDS